MAVGQAAQRIVEDVLFFLRTIRDEIAGERQPFASDIRRIVGSSLALKFGEYVQFLEKYGFLTFERRGGLLGVTRAGTDLLSGKEKALKALADDIIYHFGERLSGLQLNEPGPRAVGAHVDNRYYRMNCLGSGGFTRVWSGFQLSINRPVAIKIFEGLDELARGGDIEPVLRDIELSVRQSASLSSPFILQVLDQNLRYDTPYLVTELAEGGNLKAAMEKGPFAPAIALKYLIQMAQGLDAAHRKDVIHRDLKPENVLLDEFGNAKIGDFGLSRLTGSESNLHRRTYVGYGSIGYMAPESFRQGSGIGPNVDVYALGILFYEMLTGSLPGRRSPVPSAVVDGLPPQLDDLFENMVEDQPDRRIGNVKRILDTIWNAPEVMALLDKKSVPLFLEAPVELVGLSANLSPPPEITPPSREQTNGANLIDDAPFGIGSRTENADDNVSAKSEGKPLSDAETIDPAETAGTVVQRIEPAEPMKRPTGRPRSRSVAPKDKAPEVIRHVQSTRKLNTLPDPETAVYDSDESMSPSIPGTSSLLENVSGLGSMGEHPGIDLPDGADDTAMNRSFGDPISEKLAHNPEKQSLDIGFAVSEVASVDIIGEATLATPVQEDDVSVDDPAETGDIEE